MRMQLNYFWILSFCTLSFLTSCAQQNKSATEVPSVSPYSLGNQSQQNAQSFPVAGVAPSAQQNAQNFPVTGVAPSAQQNAQSFPVPEVPPPPQQSTGSQPQKNAQGFPNFEVPAEKSQPQQLPTHFSVNSKRITQTKLTSKTGQQKPSKFTAQTTKRVQPSGQNQVQKKQSQAQKILNDQILTEADLLPEVAHRKTSPNSSLRLSLSEAFQRADARNPQLLAAQRNLNISAAGITIAGVRPNPQIALQYGFGSVYDKSANPQQLSLNQTVELGGKRSKRISVAKSQYELAVLQYNSTRFDTHGQVRRAYAELAAAQASFRSQQEQIQLLQKLVYIALKRFEAGAAPEAELLQAQLALNQTVPQLRQARGRIQQARIQLNALLGDSPAQNIEINDPGMFNMAVKNTQLVPTPDVQLPAVEKLLAQAYEQRPDFKSARQQTEVGQQQLRLAKALRIPDLQLSGGYLFTTADAPTQNTNGVFFGVTVNLPIFYRQQGEVAQAQATMDQSVEQQNVVRSQIAVDVRTAYEALLIAREKIRKYQSQLLPDSREVLGLAQESYQVGKTNLASAIAVQQADQQIRSGYVDAVTAYQSAYADLEKAVGTPLSF